MNHQHSPEHWPKNDRGYAVCSCGATASVKDGKIDGGWHTCKLCTHPWGLPA